MNDGYITEGSPDEWAEDDNWQAAQQQDNEERRRFVSDAWQRIKRGEYTDRDIETIEHELRAVL